jgi:hypothetical protein
MAIGFFGQHKQIFPAKVIYLANGIFRRLTRTTYYDTSSYSSYWYKKVSWWVSTRAALFYVVLREMRYCGFYVSGHRPDD